MSEDQFTKLFNYIENRFDAVEKKLDEKADKKDVEKLINVINSYAAKIDT